MSAKGTKEKKVKVYGSKLLKTTRYKNLPFNLPRVDYYLLCGGQSITLPIGFVKQYEQYFEVTKNGNR